MTLGVYFLGETGVILFGLQMSEIFLVVDGAVLRSRFGSDLIFFFTSKQ